MQKKLLPVELTSQIENRTLSADVHAIITPVPVWARTVCVSDGKLCKQKYRNTNIINTNFILTDKLPA